MSTTTNNNDNKNIKKDIKENKEDIKKNKENNKEDKEKDKDKENIKENIKENSRNELKNDDKQIILLIILIIFRIFNALITNTYFNADEYWQSVEVSHYMCLELFKVDNTDLFVIICLILTNLPLAYYANTVHQRGVVEVMDYLRKEVDNKKVENIGFLMPCHSTPFYSNLHRNIAMWFLTCEPPLNISSQDFDQYMDESDHFYANPLEFINTHFEPLPLINDNNYDYLWPSHLVIFEALLQDLGTLLEKSVYNQDSRRKGDVIVYCRNAE
ncbi:3836_t:CDS:2 [Diversispora eburnea]|uniref:Mannosyltransferase n=1 Tax=Diversispora eburnea TaxID=1213867 RepID=A0A9N8YJH7_9GLOM|nr:3836_t:CDS:2 [Diversispora eburnea]